MKKLLQAIVLAAGLLAFSGCATRPVDKVVQMEGVVIYSVDTYMQGWAEWVKAGKATQAQVDSVKAAYATYYDSQMIVKAALEKWIASKSENDANAMATANLAVGVARDSLVNLIMRYTNKL